MLLRGIFKWVLAASLALNIVLIGLGTNPGSFSPLMNKAQTITGQDTRQAGETPEYIHRKSLFESLPVQEGSIVFLGDSLTQFNEWPEQFGTKRVINRGISGDTSLGVFNRLDDIVKVKAKKLFLMVGINDLGNGESIDVIVKNVENIIGKMAKESSGTRIYLQSCLPVNTELYGNKISNQDVRKLNSSLHSTAEKYNITFIDLYSLMLDGNNLSTSYTKDGLHLNGEAYGMWKKAITRFIDENQ